MDAVNGHLDQLETPPSTTITHALSHAARSNHSREVRHAQNRDSAERAQKGRRGGRAAGRAGRGQGQGKSHSALGGQPSKTAASSAPREGQSHASGNGDIHTSGDGALSPEETVEAEVCFICASAVVHNAVSPCNHRTCHICALRLRALYKTRACAHCRVSSLCALGRRC